MRFLEPPLAGATNHRLPIGAGSKACDALDGKDTAFTLSHINREPSTSHVPRRNLPRLRTLLRPPSVPLSLTINRSSDALRCRGADRVGRHYLHPYPYAIVCQEGTAVCTADATSHTKAKGDEEEALAFTNSTATATGEGAHVDAHFGSTATATGMGADASALEAGTTKATGEGATMFAQRSSTATATATVNSTATATENSAGVVANTDATATAIGNDAEAIASSDCEAEAIGDGAMDFR